MMLVGAVHTSIAPRWKPGTPTAPNHTCFNKRPEPMRSQRAARLAPSYQERREREETSAYLRAIHKHTQRVVVRLELEH
jgi:hypothetical protein